MLIQLRAGGCQGVQDVDPEMAQGPCKGWVWVAEAHVARCHRGGLLDHKTLFWLSAIRTKCVGMPQGHAYLKPVRFCEKSKLMRRK